MHRHGARVAEVRRERAEARARRLLGARGALRHNGSPPRRAACSSRPTRKEMDLMLVGRLGQTRAQEQVLAAKAGKAFFRR